MEGYVGLKKGVLWLAGCTIWQGGRESSIFRHEEGQDGTAERQQRIRVAEYAKSGETGRYGEAGRRARPSGGQHGAVGSSRGCQGAPWGSSERPRATLRSKKRQGDAGIGGTRQDSRGGYRERIGAADHR